MKIAMRKVIAVIILVLLGGVLFWYTGQKMDGGKNETVETGPSPYELIMERNLETDYPQTPEEVIAYLSKINEYIYGPQSKKSTDFFEVELPILVKQQRLMYDPELLSVNTAEANLEAVKQEIMAYEKIKLEIKGSQVVPGKLLPFKDKKKRKMAMMKVVFDTNESQKIYMEYGVRLNGQQWKIAGFKSTAPFTKATTEE